LSIRNFIFIVLLILSYILFASYIQFQGILIVQLVLLVIAISPIGEVILRFIYGARAIRTNKDKEKLLPLFNEVYDTIKENKKFMRKSVKLYLDKSIYINAYAMGRNTISITKGAIDSLTDNQIKGLIAHEFRTYYERRYNNSFGTNCRKCIFLYCNVYNQNL